MESRTTPASAGEAQAQQTAVRIRWGLLAAIGAGIAALAALSFYRASHIEEPLPVLFGVPSFSLTDQTGRTVTRESLLGKVFVANFIFTSCPTVCPLLSRKMAQLSDEVATWREYSDQVRFVSLTVDPQTDTVEKLAAYAERYHADAGRWMFLTGPAAEVESAVVQGFKIAMGRADPPAAAGKDAPDAFSIVHGEMFVLVDRRGRIRGYYKQDDEGTPALRRDLQRVLKERP